MFSNNVRLFSYLVIFPESIRALAPSDERSPLIYQIIANLFN